MGLLGRGGPVPRGRARSLEAGFLRLCDAHARAHAGGVVVLVFLASLPPRPPRWIARWACSDEAGLVANSVARGGPPAAAACCAPAHARPQARTHVGGPVVCGLGDGAGCRMHSGGGARARRHGGASRGMGPRAAHAGRGLSVRSWSLSSAPAAPATQRGSTPAPPRRWRLAGCRTRSGGGVRAQRHGGTCREMGPCAAHAGRGLVCPLLVSELRSCRASHPTRTHPPPPARRWRLAGCRTRSGGGVRTRRQGDVCRGVGPRATHAGRGLVCPLLVSELRSCRASHPTRTHPPPPPRVVGGWRDVARAAAVECERSGMEAPAVRWGRAPRTRDGGLSVRSWFSGLRAPHTTVVAHGDDMWRSRNTSCRMNVE